MNVNPYAKIGQIGISDFTPNKDNVNNFSNTSSLSVSTPLRGDTVSFSARVSDKNNAEKQDMPLGTRLGQWLGDKMNDIGNLFRRSDNVKAEVVAATNVTKDTNPFASNKDIYTF